MHHAHYGKLLYTTLAMDGGTFAHNGARVDIDCGFVVGGAIPSLVVPVREIPERGKEIRAYLANVPQTCFVGTWVHDGAVHFDANDHVDDFWAALSLAMDRGELAILDGEFNREYVI